jgi:hypothetical protein
MHAESHWFKPRIVVFVLVEPLSQAKSFFGHWLAVPRSNVAAPKLQPKLQPRPEQTCPNPKPKLCVSAHCRLSARPESRTSYQRRTFEHGQHLRLLSKSTDEGILYTPIVGWSSPAHPSLANTSAHSYRISVANLPRVMYVVNMKAWTQRVGTRLNARLHHHGLRAKRCGALLCLHRRFHGVDR